MLSSMFPLQLKWLFKWMSDLQGIKIKEKYSPIGSGLLSEAPHLGLLVHPPEWKIQKYLLHLPHPRCWSPSQWSLCAGPPCGVPCRMKWRTFFTGWPLKILCSFSFIEICATSLSLPMIMAYQSKVHLLIKKDARRANVWVIHCNNYQNTTQNHSLIPIFLN